MSQEDWKSHQAGLVESRFSRKRRARSGGTRDFPAGRFRVAQTAYNARAVTRANAMYGDVTGPGRELHARFLALGNMSGKTSDQIIASVGRPTSIGSLARGNVLLQWQATGCHMAILFDANGRFVKVTHQYANYAPAPEPLNPLVMTLLVAFGIVMAIIMVISSIK
jgi:hypothetical protein